jgi:hypothetical protein
MGLGPTLVGGIIGAVVGVALHLVVETSTDYEAPWFAIIIGALTGLGVSQANRSLAGRVSYARGAVAAGIALAAIVGSTPLIAAVAAYRDRPADSAPDLALDAPPAESQASAAGADGAKPGEDAAAPRLVDARSAEMGILDPPLKSGGLNLWQFVCMAVGTFIAYEYGRGTAASKAAVEPRSATSHPAITDVSS